MEDRQNDDDESDFKNADYPGGMPESVRSRLEINQDQQCEEGGGSRHGNGDDAAAVATSAAAETLDDKDPRRSLDFLRRRGKTNEADAPPRFEKEKEEISATEGTSISCLPGAYHGAPGEAMRRTQDLSFALVGNVCEDEDITSVPRIGDERTNSLPSLATPFEEHCLENPTQNVSSQQDEDDVEHSNETVRDSASMRDPVESLIEAFLVTHNNQTDSRDLEAPLPTTTRLEDGQEQAQRPPPTSPTQQVPIEDTVEVFMAERINLYSLLQNRSILLFIAVLLGLVVTVSIISSALIVTLGLNVEQVEKQPENQPPLPRQSPQLHQSLAARQSLSSIQGIAMARETPRSGQYDICGTTTSICSCCLVLFLSRGTMARRREINVGKLLCTYL